MQSGGKAARPLSPHLQIYRPQITSALSILHRITGVALSVGTLMLTWWLLAAAAGPDHFALAHGFITSWLGWLLLLGWSVALFYHLSNGIRHLAWDAGWGFELPQVYKSGYAVIAATVILTAIAWGVGLTMGS